MLTAVSYFHSINTYVVASLFDLDSFMYTYVWYVKYLPLSAMFILKLLA